MSQVVRQKLQGDKAMQGYIFGLIDNTHSATTQLLDDAVVRDCLADHWRESYVPKMGKSMKVGNLGAFQV